MNPEFIQAPRYLSGIFTGTSVRLSILRCRPENQQRVNKSLQTVHLFVACDPLSGHTKKSSYFRTGHNPEIQI